MTRFLLGFCLLFVDYTALPATSRPARVEVLLIVPCRASNARPSSWAGVMLKASDSLQVKARVLPAERRQRQGYGLELQAMLRAYR